MTDTKTRFNQLVGSCAQLVLENEQKNPAMKIHTVKWKEGALLVGARTFSRGHDAKI